MKSQWLPLALTLIAAISGAGANLLFKRASSQIVEVPIYQNYALFSGLTLFTLVLVLFLTAFRMGGETLVIYPTYATTYIWILILGRYFDQTEISRLQALGILLIILGVSLIGSGLQKATK